MYVVPHHLLDHNYAETESSRSSTNSNRVFTCARRTTCCSEDCAFGSTPVCAAVNRKRRRELESSPRALEEPLERRARQAAAAPSDRSPSPQPSTSATVERRRPRALQQLVDDSHGIILPSPSGPQPSTSAPQATLEGPRPEPVDASPGVIFPRPYRIRRLPPSFINMVVELVSTYHREL